LDCALFLEMIQGKDGLDFRQSACPNTLPSYTERLKDCPSPLNVGIVKEGFDWEVSEPEVDRHVRKALQKASKAHNIKLEEISIPLHRQGIHFWNGIGIEGTFLTMVRDEGLGHGHLGYYDSHLASFYGPARRNKGFDYSPTVKLVILLGDFMRSTHTGRFYAKAQNLRWTLKSAYDEALKNYHVLAMPTTPMRPFRIQHFNTAETLDYGLRPLLNTAPFDVSSHPAISIPACTLDGLPVGLMLIAKPFDELTLLQAAYALEGVLASV
jgi:amidase